MRHALRAFGMITTTTFRCLPIRNKCGNRARRLICANESSPFDLLVMSADGSAATRGRAGSKRGTAPQQQAYSSLPTDGCITAMTTSAVASAASSSNNHLLVAYPK